MGTPPRLSAERIGDTGRERLTKGGSRTLEPPRDPVRLQAALPRRGILVGGGQRCGEGRRRRGGRRWCRRGCGVELNDGASGTLVGEVRANRGQGQRKVGLRDREWVFGSGKFRRSGFRQSEMRGWGHRVDGRWRRAFSPSLFLSLCAFRGRGVWWSESHASPLFFFMLGGCS